MEISVSQDDVYEPYTNLPNIFLRKIKEVEKNLLGKMFSVDYKISHAISHASHKNNATQYIRIWCDIIGENYTISCPVENRVLKKIIYSMYVHTCRNFQFRFKVI